MKPKTARRILNRNAFKLIQLRVDKVTLRKAEGKDRELLKQEKAALKVLKKEVK